MEYRLYDNLSMRSSETFLTANEIRYILCENCFKENGKKKKKRRRKKKKKKKKAHDVDHYSINIWYGTLGGHQSTYGFPK